MTNGRCGSQLGVGPPCIELLLIKSGIGLLFGIKLLPVVDASLFRISETLATTTALAGFGSCVFVSCITPAIPLNTFPSFN